jgi:hypothetical protein
MIEAMISEMEAAFCKGVFSEKKAFRFRLEESTITITVDAESYHVERGANAEPVDCDCKTGSDMFKKIWYDRYRPGIMDFLSGAIECDNPLLLPQFLRAFGR